MEKYKKITKLVKENWTHLMLLALVALLIKQYVLPEFGSTFSKLDDVQNSKTTAQSAEETYQSLKQEQERRNRAKQIVKEDKTIFDAPGLKFSPDASFAPLFELVLNYAQQSGIKIRSIDYDYAPETDIIYSAKFEGYNTCYLTMVVLGTYNELQTFTKFLIREKSLINISETELIPWEKDNKILIASFKIGLYTRTISN